MRISETRPSNISPLHEIKDIRKYKTLVESMEDNGWQGRPLVVISLGESYQALTGSHRHAAAMAAGVEIPIAIVDIDIEQFCEEQGCDLDEILCQLDYYTDLIAENDIEAADLLAQD